MMYRRQALLVGCGLAVVAAAWVGRAQPPREGAAGWDVAFAADGLTVRRSPSAPAAYLLEAGGTVILIDAPLPPDTLPAKPAVVLLTHHHRDTVAAAAAFVAAGVPVRAAPESAKWLKPDTVMKFWADSIPLRDSRTAYFVAPDGVEGIEYVLNDGYELPLGGWLLKAVPTPGHARDHTTFVVTKDGDSPLVFCGDAVTGAGKLWTPFTTDWNHWTDEGLKPAADSLRKLARLNPAALFPARGPVVKPNARKLLDDAAAAVEEAAFLKSFERFTDRTGSPPNYDFLVPKEQIASGGDKPWARVSPHLWLTGNTYVLKAADSDACLVLDPWGQKSVDQVAKLRRDEKLGPVGVVIFSHAHYDHFDGVYTLPGRDKYLVWALDRVAEPLADPFKFRAPFLDARPIKFDRLLKDGDAATWGGYTFRFRHLPGQTEFTSGIETTIDGKRCVFTADNFFHQRQFSGSGGWMGLNRSFPPRYAESAKKVLDAAPEWVLAEHGGPYVFAPEDYRRRVAWGEAAGKAADAVSPSGKHLLDWNPHRVAVEPILVKAKPGQVVQVKLNVAAGQRELTVRLDGRGVFPDVVQTFPAGVTSAVVAVRLPTTLTAGRHVFAVRPTDAGSNELADPFLAVNVERSDR